jgi:sorting nexin-29
VEYHIQKTKNNKAPGEDNIAEELIKHGGEALVDAVYKLIRTIWKTEKMPDRCKLGIICLTYKKGDKLECGNYRGITLLSAAYKILTSIVNERVQKVTERIIGDYQCGFLPNKGTTDHLFIIRQMMEKNWEHGFDLCMLFIDFEQAFNSANRRKLSKAMEEVEIKQKLIKLIEITLKDMKAAVKINTVEPPSIVFQGDRETKR